MPGPVHVANDQDTRGPRVCAPLVAAAPALLAVCLCTLLPACRSAHTGPGFPDRCRWVDAPAGTRSGELCRMSVRELQRLLKRDAEMLLVDVRSEREFRGRLGHVEEAENVPLEAVYSGRFRFQRGRPLVFICRKGVRSLDAAEFMARRGYTAYSVDGGMLDWRRMKDGDGGGFRVLDGGEGC